MAEGAPLLREYVGKTCIEGSNPSVSAKPKKAITRKTGGFFLFPQRSSLRMSNLSLEKLKAFKLNKRRLTIQLTVVIRFKTQVSFYGWCGAAGVASIGDWSFSLLSGKVFSLRWCSRPALC